MSDQLMGWLSYVGLLLALVVPISRGLAEILRDLDSMLASLLSMRARLRQDRRETMALNRPRKCRTGQHGHKSRRTSS